MAKKIDYNKVNRESLEKVQYDLIAMLQNETSNIRGNHNPCCNYIELKALAQVLNTSADDLLGLTDRSDPHELP